MWVAAALYPAPSTANRHDVPVVAAPRRHGMGGPLEGFQLEPLEELAAHAPKTSTPVAVSFPLPLRRGTRLPQTGAAEHDLPFVKGRQTPCAGLRAKEAWSVLWRPLHPNIPSRCSRHVLGSVPPNGAPQETGSDARSRRNES